jgi:hypothetical protein
MANARLVAEAVQRFADTGQGIVLPGESREYLLFVGDYVPVLRIDRDMIYASDASLPAVAGKTHATPLV